ncbi:MAG: hypothetical protein ETSY2_38985 [Candidatus Entotheonella gemina]|uniref:OmpR/PhoB-type domain-containing protein n=1 Tax=Candidatus Entotheonella gemina TaxID=1429439 RepID=W4LSU0_9BACT|nr:MAG: hypothetical protein ETSY2_38985 [Candidatus Entotheonella gemina]
MPGGRILFADNDETFRTTRARFLTGYDIVHASSAEEAEQVLQNQWIHLAILDIRMQDDAEEQDVSGLLLAKQDTYRSVPKIMLTGFPNYRDVREALGPLLDGLPPAIDFIAKQDGPEVIVEAVEQAFARYVRINWELDIQSNDRHPITFPSLVMFMETSLEGELLSQRARELEDLFRGLFYDKSQITLGRILWQRMGHVALTVFAFQAGTLPESFVVVFGQHATMLQATQRYQTFAPKTQDKLGTVLNIRKETTHFAVNAYTLVNADLESVQTLADFYKIVPDKLFHTSLEYLFQTSLTAWHQNKKIPENTKTLASLYDERFDSISYNALTEIINILRHQASSLDIYIEHDAEFLKVHIYGQVHTYPDPIRVLQRQPVIEQPVVLFNTPGTLSGDNILTDTSGQIWLTDFADAGLAPLLWNIVALEAIIRFDWTETSDLRALYDMEHSLTASSFSKLDMRDIAPPLRKPVRAIQMIRQHATRLVGAELLPYHIGMLYEAANRLARFNPNAHYPTSEMVRFIHILIAAAMLGEMIQRDQQHPTAGKTPEERGIRIDPDERAVWVDGVRITLRGQSFDLLCDLYNHANQLCTRRDLVERVFKQVYDETDRSQINRLNTAISRLRDQIETDPGHPRYLLTEPGGGYRLTLPK